METTWRETSSGEIVFEHHVEMGPRLIVGLMLAPIAAFFLYHLVSGLIDYVRFATWAEWLSAVPGLLFLLVISLALGVGIWIVFAGRSRVVLDLPRGQVREVHDLRFHQRTKIFPIDQVLDVEVKKKTLRTRSHNLKSSDHSTITWMIQLTLRDGARPITVGYEETPEKAEEVAQWLVAHLRR